MDETSGCDARRALNARERSGDATSGDERRRDGEASPAAASPSARVLLAQRALGEDRAAGLPTYQFLRSSTSARAARARLRTELDRPTDRCPPPDSTTGPTAVHEMQSTRTDRVRPRSERRHQWLSDRGRTATSRVSARGQRGGTSGFLTEGGLPRHACPPAVREAAPVAF